MREIMDELKKNIHRVLNYDALDAAEKFTGARYEDNKETMALGFALHLSSTRLKRDMLKSMNDSYFGCPKGEFKMIVERFGFEEIFKLDFYSESSKKMESLNIMWYKGILLVYDTYIGNVNGGKAYFNYLVTSPYDVACNGHAFDHVSGGMDTKEEIWMNYKGFKLPDTFFCGWDHKADDRWVKFGDIDCRRGLIFHLTTMLQYGEFLEKWVRKPFLWILHHMDTKEEGYDYEAINKERISLFPKEIIEAISPKEEF